MHLTCCFILCGQFIMENLILLCGTCRIIFNKTSKLFKHENNTYVQQPINYSTSLNEVINNLEYLTKEKQLSDIPKEIVTCMYHYNCHGKMFYDNKIDLSKTICVIEICSKKYNKYGSFIIPYNNKNENIDPIKKIENTQSQLEYIIDNYNFKAIVLLPPITFGDNVPPEVVQLKSNMINQIRYVSDKSNNVYLFDWNELFTKSSFKDRFHFTDDFKLILFDELNEFILKNIILDDLMN